MGILLLVRKEVFISQMPAGDVLKNLGLLPLMLRVILQVMRDFLNLPGLKFSCDLWSEYVTVGYVAC